jgi:endoglucanase
VPARRALLVVVLALVLAPVARADGVGSPVNTVAPSISDESSVQGEPVRVGDTIKSTPGTWTDASGVEPGYTYEWQRCLSTCQAASPPNGGFFSDSNLYTVTAADVGATLRLVVTAFDSTGVTASAVSNEIGPVAPPGVYLGNLPADNYRLLWRGDLKYLWIPVNRDGSSGVETVGYRIWDPNAGPDAIFTPITGVLQMADGQRGWGIAVPVKPNGVPIMPASLEVALYGGSPLGVVAPSEMTIPMTPDPASFVRDPANPLALPTRPPAGNPVAGAHFFADYFQSLPAVTALAWSTDNPLEAEKVAVIAREPNTERFGAWNGAFPGWNVATYLDRAAKTEPGTVPLISTYRVVSGHCGRWSDPPAAQAAYHAWITSLAEGIGPHPAVLFLEMDSLITVGCLSPQGVAVRMAELHDAINVLSNDPHLVTYLDAGAADALPARETASLLRRAGVAQIQGFFLNSTHFDWTSKEIAYGEKISRLTRGKHFVINTAENGQGPLRPRHPAKQGNEVLCDPAGRGLGPLPTSHTGYRNVDAFAWIANPGVSGGRCRPGAPPSGVFWPPLALDLVHHENFRVR